MTPRHFSSAPPKRRRTPRITPRPTLYGLGPRSGLTAATWADSYPDT
jgi:hypothetical protein